MQQGGRIARGLGDILSKLVMDNPLNPNLFWWFLHVEAREAQGNGRQLSVDFPVLRQGF